MYVSMIVGMRIPEGELDIPEVCGYEVVIRKKFHEKRLAGLEEKQQRLKPMARHQHIRLGHYILANIYIHSIKT